MARFKNHNLTTRYLWLFLMSTLISLASVAVTASDAPLCSIPSPMPKQIAVAGEDALALLQPFQISAGYFFGGEEIHFAKDGEGNEWSRSYYQRSFSLLPHSVERTDDGSGLLHVAATLTLTGGRSHLVLDAGRRRQRRSFVNGHTVSFLLSGYYSTSGELCMTGAGSYSDDDGAIRHLSGVMLKLHVPKNSSLFDPFVTGSLQGSGLFKAVSLVAYAEGDSYRYGEPASCAAPARPSARGAFQALGGADFSCARLKEHLVRSFKLEYGGDAHAPPSTSATLPWLHEPRMHVGQVQCAADGAAVRAYAFFSNDTETRRGWRAPPGRPSFTVKEAAVVAEGRWDSARNMLCLRACRVLRSKSEPASLEVRPQECGVRISFWFPAVWTIRERSAVAGLLWNSSQAAVGGASAVSASSVSNDIHRSNFSDVKYKYNDTMVEEAKNRYLTSGLSKCSKKNKGSSFVSANYTYRDFEFEYSERQRERFSYGRGRAYPVSIDSVIVYGDRLAADESFSRKPVATKDNELLKVSYEIRRRAPPAGWVPPTNRNTTISHLYMIPTEEHLITAEGVYDPKTGVLSLIGCRELNGSADCEMLITVQFASLDAKGQGHGNGAMSSLREKTDALFFEKVDFHLFGMYAEEISESVSWMDMESVMLAVSTTLPCVYTVLQILHAKRNPEASATTSITMLVVVALGYVAPILVTPETLFTSRRTQWLPFQSYVPYELNQAMLRAPTLIALLLQLRLLQLARSRRKSDQSKAEAWSAAERRALWVCLPLYLAGGALTIVVNVVNRRRVEGSLTVHVGPPPATLWQDLVSSAGLALDGFLLPQVAMNVFSAAGGVTMARAISPWFYVGGTVVRAMPHVYDVIRRQGYVPSVRPSYVYAGPRDDRFGLAWDVVVPCVTGLLAVLLFLQQRRAGAFLPRSRKPGGYEMVSSTSI